MNTKIIGTILIVLGIVLSASVYMIKTQEDAIIKKVVSERNSCFLEDGTCLHEDRKSTFFIIGWVISGMLVIAGVYLHLMEHAQKEIANQNKQLSLALLEAKKEERKKDEFTAFLAGFSKDEQLILKAVREQDGILQSTLRFRTGIQKSTLSQMLKSLEEREFISRKVSGKTNSVFLRKKF